MRGAAGARALWASSSGEIQIWTFPARADEILAEYRRRYPSSL